MRTTKVMSFSVLPEFEEQILIAARIEHRTVSEFLREAIRRYLSEQKFSETRKAVTTRLQEQGLKESDVEEVLKELRGG